MKSSAIVVWQYPEICSQSYFNATFKMVELEAMNGVPSFNGIVILFVHENSVIHLYKWNCENITCKENSASLKKGNP